MLTTKPHWSDTIADYLLTLTSQDNSASVQPEDDELIKELFTRLAQALDLGDTVVTLSVDELAIFSQINHPALYFLSHTQIQELETINKPLVIDNGLAYIHRQWLQEKTLANNLLAFINNSCNQTDTTLDNATGSTSNVDLSKLPAMHEKQKEAVQKAIANRFCLITGGPGTGKTWTVAQLVIALLRHNPNIKIALIAPTGKASQRMQEALENGINSSLEHLSNADNNETAIFRQQLAHALEQAKTIHRLLGIGFQTKPRFNQQKPLPYDLIIVDEASMLGVELANHLINAIGKQTKVVLLGDANQLSAVDAGAVLADICGSNTLKNHHVELTKSRRFDEKSGIGLLANNILQEKIDNVETLLVEHEDISHINLGNKKQSKDNHYASLWQDFIPYADMLSTLYKQKLKHIAKTKIDELFDVFDTYRVLTATHHGFFGGNQINDALSQSLQNHLVETQKLHQQPSTNTHSWFHGRPVMILKNDYQLKLSNGDIGICLLDENDDYLLFFPQHTHAFPVQRLSENNLTTAFAMTIHKSQGSEYQKVAIALEPEKPNDVDNKLLSRELLYTGITRAKEKLAIYADNKTIVNAIRTQASRQTGLGKML